MVCERYDTIYSSKYNTRRTSLSAATVRKHVRTGWNDKAKGKNATRIKIERVAYRWRATVILRTFSIYKLIESFSKSRSTDRKSHNRFQNEKENKESSTSFVRLNERVQNFSFYSKYFFFFHNVKNKLQDIFSRMGYIQLLYLPRKFSKFLHGKKMKRATKKMQIYKGIDYRTNTRVVRFSRVVLAGTRLKCNQWWNVTLYTNEGDEKKNKYRAHRTADDWRTHTRMRTLDLTDALDSRVRLAAVSERRSSLSIIGNLTGFRGLLRSGHILNSIEPRDAASSISPPKVGHEN